MTAVAEATRGPIEEVTRIRYGMTADAAQAERMGAMDQTLEELESVLAQPVYEGDVQTALLHNMGRAAFGFSGTGDDHVQDYIRFSEAIDADTTEGPTPVLLVSQIESGAGIGGNTETALVLVDVEETTFRSSVAQERDVQRAGYSGKIAVTRRSLSLVGDTSKIHADISGYGRDRREIHRHADQKTGEAELILNERSVIDGKNARTPVRVGHDGYTQDADRMWAGPTYLVGWKDIGDALTTRIDSNVRGDYMRGQEPQGTLPYILNLRSFFERTGQLEALLERNNPLKRIFKHAVSLEESLAALAPASNDEDWD